MKTDPLRVDLLIRGTPHPGCVVHGSGGPISVGEGPRALARVLRKRPVVRVHITWTAGESTWVDVPSIDVVIVAIRNGEDEPCTP